MVSNLAKSVTQDDVRELFAQIGPVKSAQLNYDANGRSKGVATIIFSRAGDAQKAIREYHNRTLDNKPMKIELIVRADAPALTAPRATIASRLGGGGRSGGLAGRRGGDRRRGAGGNRSTHKKTPKTQEELDAEMEAYMKEEGAAMDVDGSQAATAASSNGINVNLANALM
ncbi:hypothetical protein BC832DRAFT_239276 [Gaertneriomyces semiglobifer]|nr:hypothetical protein BC832DRAFT_239276 [Gaertneriomyces semiglobifer]